MAKRVGERKLKATPTNQIEGKLQPQAIELEQAVLGALLIDNESLSDAIDSLQAEYFYVPKHQKIFEAIVNLFNNTKPVDILTVSEELKRLENFDNIGGLAYISELTNNVASSSNTEFHARIIAEKFIKRSLINISRRISTDAFDDAVDIFDLLSPKSPRLDSLNQLSKDTLKFSRSVLIVCNTSLSAKDLTLHHISFSIFLILSISSSISFSSSSGRL